MTYKEKLLPSLLCGFAFSFTFFFFGIVEMYVGNKEEFDFQISHIMLYLVLFAILAFVIVFSILFLLNGLAHRIAFAIFLSITVMGYIQGTFLNAGINTLSNDNVGTQLETWVIVVNTIIWVIGLALIIVGVLNMKKLTWVKTVSIVLLVLVIGMQLAGCAQIAIQTTTSSSTDKPQTNESTSTNTETDPVQTDKPDEPVEVPGTYVMTTKGLYNVSKNKNCIVFILDRFDISFYEDLLEDYGDDCFINFNDFTLYTDNMSTYSRTYPGITSMLTGIDFTGDMDAEEYFQYAYSHSNFLNDLQANDYRIKIYTQSYYAYRSPKSLAGIAYNMERTDNNAVVTDPLGLTSAFWGLSAYRYLPIVAKDIVSVSSGSFSGYVSYDDVYPLFNSDDNVAMYDGLKQYGLEIDDSENSFTFIHIIGCHDPYEMDYYGNYKENASSSETVKGCFNMIEDYIQELKRLGRYDDSMIIITGDHPRARSDGKKPSEPRITTLFVKNIGEKHDSLVISDAGVSQDMLIPSIVKGLGLKTNNEYGLTYKEVEEGNLVVTRRHIFELYTEDGTFLVEYNVKGNGKEFDNWEIVNEKNIGSLYK